jgi:subtilisin family serine protease
MGPSTPDVRRSVRLSPSYAKGLLACALLSAGCVLQPLEGEGTGADDQSQPAPIASDAGGPSSQGGQGGSASTVVDPFGKIDPTLSSDPNPDQPREVIALLDERFLPVTPLDQIAVSPTDGDRAHALVARLNLAKDGILDRLRAHRLVPMTRFQNLPAIHLRVDSAAALTALAADPSVARVVPNQSHSVLDTPASLTLINQPKAATAGKLGAGTAVAVLDTGTDYKRAPFNCASAGATGCPIVYAADFAPQDNNVDDNGHGTNVSGIVLSVAPSARIIALDVFNGASAWTTDIMTAIDWCIQNKVKYNIVAINMSLGGGLSTTPCAQDALAVSIASARTAGILSAVASGNSGSTNAISSPACGPDAVSVGAVHAANLGGLQWSSCGDPTTNADQVACFSCSSSFLTVLAPGVMVTAAGITMSGTSQATPHVAGAIAVLRAAFPTETPTAIVNRLTAYGTPVKDPRNGITKPRLDLWAALNATTPTPTPAPVPTPGPTGTIALNAKAAFTNTANVSATLAVTSGTATQVCLSESTSCTNWVGVAATQTFTLSASDGSKTVRAWWRNAAGTVSTTAATASIILDRTAPTDGVLAGSATGLQVSFTWSGFSDAGSGISAYRLITGTTTAIAAGCLTGTVSYEGTAGSFVKTFSAAGTIYARVCAKDSTGNLSAGSSLAMVLAVPAVVTRTAVLAGADRTTQVGNLTGGVAFDDGCPAGQALVGFAGSLSTATGVHRQIAGHCGVIQIVGTTVSIKAGATLPTRGKAGTSSWTRDCPANQVVVGFSGRSGLLVDQIAFSCAPLVASGSTSGSALTVGTSTTLAAIGGTGGTAFTTTKCLTGEVATLARVRAGDNLDAFGLACGKATVGP